MQRTPVESSNIDSVGFDEKTGTWAAASGSTPATRP